MASGAKALVKRLGKQSWPLILAGFCMAMYIYAVRATGRWRTEGREKAVPFVAEEKPIIAAFWHGRMTMMPMMWTFDTPVRMLISQSGDGEIPARMLKYFGIATVRGSSKKGGAEALAEIRRHLRNGECIGFTPDGPNGPRMRAQPGVIVAAKAAGVPIFPVAFGASRRRIFAFGRKKWDRFVLPLPFARGVWLWGDPIEVPKTLDAAGLEAKRLELEAALNALTEEADRRMGQPVIAPAPPVVEGVAA